MVRRAFILIFLFSGVAFADTYLYRVNLALYTKLAAKALTSTVEIKDKTQPFYNAYALDQNDTNYVLVKVTPKDGADPILERFTGVDLFQVQRIDEKGFIINVIDNSALYPTDKRWDLSVSSGPK